LAVKCKFGIFCIIVLICQQNSAVTNDFVVDGNVENFVFQARKSCDRNPMHRRNSSVN